MEEEDKEPEIRYAYITFKSMRGPELVHAAYGR